MENRGGGREVWTAKRVEARLIAALAALPSSPVFGGGRLGFRQVAGGSSVHAEALSWAARFVENRQDSLVLLTWARCRASGDSVRARYDALGWKRSSSEDARRRALARIVMCLEKEQEGLDSRTNRPGASHADEAKDVLAIC